MRLQFLLIILAIISAGCVGFPGTSGSGTGISMSSMSFAPSKLNNNQLTKLTLSVENTGEYNIENAQMFLFGLPSDWTIEEGATSETFNLLASGIRGGKDYPGEKKNFLWILRSPQALPRDESFPFEVRARICYPYKTTVSGKIEVISESYWLQKQPSQHQINLEQSKGPVKVEILSTQPVIAQTDTKMKVRVTNIGDGTITSNDCSAFSADRSEEETEAAVQQLNKITIGNSDCTFEEDIYLQKGQFKEMLITCNVPPLGDAPQASDYFSIELNYNYYVDRSTSVVVMGTAEGAGAGAGGRAGVITLTDLCTKVCDANGQKEISSGKAYGVCAATTSSPEVVKYPGTTVDVMVKNLGEPPITQAVLNSALGNSAATATIKTLNLHDVNVSAIKFDRLTIENLDTKALSVQYEKSKVTGKTPGTIGIVDYFCSDAVSNSQTLTLDGKTKGALCPNSIKTQPLSNMITVNGAPGNEFEKNLISGLKITSIAGKDISAMTGGNLTAINVEDFKVSELSKNVWAAGSLETFLKYTKCDSKQSVSYASNVYCNCMDQLPRQMERFDGEANSVCNSECTKTVSGKRWADGGACNTRSILGTSQCMGTTTYITYKGGGMAITSNPCSVPKDTCACYDKHSMSATEAALLCKP